MPRFFDGVLQVRTGRVQPRAVAAAEAALGSRSWVRLVDSFGPRLPVRVPIGG